MTKLKKLLRTSFFLRFYRTFIKALGQNERKKREAFVDSHFPNVNNRKRKKLLRSIEWQYLMKGYTYEEYWQFNFDMLSFEQRRKMLPIYKIIRFYEKVNSAEEQSHMLLEKWNTYTLYKDLYKRDVCIIRKDERGCFSKTDLTVFEEFVKKHKVFIIKPLSLDSGVGVKKMTTLKDEGILQLAQRCSEEDFIAEELIVQNDSLAKFNPSSVNTLRTNTVYYNDGDIEIFRPIMRFGIGDAIVDNAHFGGMFAVVDAKSGLMTHAGDLDRHTYTHHPYTNTQIVGETIPKWEEACELSREAARRLPNHTFIGWDLALTDDGWVLVEGNSKPGLLDSALTGIGPREELKRIRKRVRKERRLK